MKPYVLSFLFVSALVLVPDGALAANIDHGVDNNDLLSYSFVDSNHLTSCLETGQDVIVLFDTQEWDTGEYIATGGLIQMSCDTDEAVVGYDLRVPITSGSYQLVHLHDDEAQFAIPGGTVMGNPNLEPYIVEVTPFTY